MKNNDVRSYLVALVPDSLVNAPAFADRAGDERGADGANLIVDVLVALGFGLVQLPPAFLAPDKAAVAIDYALDQLEDYAANGYRTIWLESRATPAEAALSDAIRSACERRGLAALEVIDLGSATSADAARLDPLLRSVAATVGSARKVRAGAV